MAWDFTIETNAAQKLISEQRAEIERLRAALESDFLLSHGYVIDEGYITVPTPSHTVSDDEGDCIMFLQMEWDYA